MDVNIDNDELELRIRAAAEKQGLQPTEYVLRVLADHVSSSGSGIRLDEVETELLAQINMGLADSEWERYHELIKRRQNESLTDEEHQELLRVSDRLEKQNVRRIECVSKLAQRRGLPLAEVMLQLGIKSREVA